MDVAAATVVCGVPLNAATVTPAFGSVFFVIFVDAFASVVYGVPFDATAL